MKFTYSSGQRPLDGFTIKRGVGKGGFGEVYFALSDGGKEVALKVLRGDQADVELRGIRQCLNLKHPNLVALFDVRDDDHGESWIIMEYVAGETLGAILNRHPRGLPHELIHQWFPALGRAVGYLHDHGIVHRDLKPANIFLEHGLLKVGDYGLSKSMSASHRSAQTQSVGTVHYMAPEIASGNYTKSVDIYALGVILYEMLTGAPPFEGESAQEVMMKHLMSLPDLTKVPGPYKQVLAKALAKDPTHRHATAAELVKDVEAIFADIPLAEPVAAKASAPAKPPYVPRKLKGAVEIPIMPRPAAPKPMPAPSPAPIVAPPVVEPPLTAVPAFSVRNKVGEIAGSLALSALLALVTTTILAALKLSDDVSAVGSLYFLTVAVCWAVLIPSKLWTARPGNEWLRRLVLTLCGAGVGLVALWLDGWTPHVPGFVSATDGPIGMTTFAAGAGYVSYFGLALGLIRWWKAADRRREHWFSFFPVLVAGVCAFALLLVWPDRDRPFGIPALVMASMIVQWVSPWQAPPPPAPKRLKLRRG
ncbi:MAG: serine/threonine protein kinase [Gemmataceae bacterium]